jgi:hypothetical protein
LLPGWDASDGWTYNHFYGTPYLRLSASVSLETLHSATQHVIAHFAPTTVYVFHDGLAAWRSRWRGNRGFLCKTPAEVIELVSTEAYFRDAKGRSDNYNVICEDGRWMITYCHEDDWFLFAPQADLNQLERKIKKPNKTLHPTTGNAPV